jgi:alkyl hydroperoxide reductase subunit AhpC
VVGVSGGDEKTKAKFCKKYSLKVPLVSDTDFKVAKSYGAYGTKQFMGRTFQGIFRKTFLVDKAGKIAHIFDTVKPEGHAQEVLAAIEALSKNGGAKATAAKATKATLKKTAAKKVSGKTAIAKRGVKAKPVRKAASAKTVRKSSATRGAKRVVKKKK